MTDKAQVKPFWVVFGPDGNAVAFGLSREVAIISVVWPKHGGHSTWEEFEQAGYRCLECVVKEGE